MSDDEIRAAALKDWHARLGRPPRDWHEGILRIDPGLFSRMTGLYESYNSNRIDPKLRHLIWVAVDAVATHLYPVGIELHARAAMNHGATAREVLEVLEMTSTLGERGFSVALPVVLEEIRAAGVLPEVLSGPESREEADLKESLRAATGACPAWIETLFRLSPDFTRGLLDLGHGSAVTGTLDARSRTLILLAVYACPATLDLDAVRDLSRRALGLGASAEELVAVLELGSGIGLHALSVGVPALLRVVEERAAAPATAPHVAR